MNYGKFRNSDQNQGENAKLGMPGLAAILATHPDFFIATGDNVYYDAPKPDVATSQAELRRKWHEQFAQPRFADLFATVPTYWEKDDHDYRRDDSDPSGNYAPSHELGIATFREQVPITDPADAHALTYRTIRLNKLVQIWLPEGRDYRSPNRMPDGPEKSIWGPKQREWLKRTLLASDATFKVMIMETPMVGPDRASKRDNHTNPNGFRHEGEAFLAWLKENGFLRKNLYLVCGDRHWQYESIHPSGFIEFSCGALVEANAIEGNRPGEPQSTDPQGLVKQSFHPERAYGGFLLVTVLPATGDKPETLRFDFYNDAGELLHSDDKPAARPSASGPGS
jgi:alkaline phosphatase D